MQINAGSPQSKELSVRLPHLTHNHYLEQSGALLAQEVQQGTQNSKQTESLREAFQDFVGQTFFAELIKSYRSTQQPSEYFNGGRAEQIFQGQLDQVLTEALSERTGHTIADPMFDLFMAKRF